MLIIKCHALNSSSRVSIDATSKLQRSSVGLRQDLLLTGAASFPCRPGYIPSFNYISFEIKTYT